MTYTDKINQLKKEIDRGQVAGFEGVKKGSTSNLFRYNGRIPNAKEKLDLSSFCEIIKVDNATKTLEVEGLATYESIVRGTLPHNLLPTVTPELRHITIGGAIVGIGIESSGFKHGFVHDGLLEADVLLSTGEVLTCNEETNADLFLGLPNSYGTLGYILRAKIRLVAAKPFVRVTTTRFDGIDQYLNAFAERAAAKKCDYLEGLFLSSDEMYLSEGLMEDEAEDVIDIYRSRQYYKRVLEQGVLRLKTEDYIFRYDPDWFWNVPERGLYSVFRRWAPKELRSSKFYNRYIANKKKIKDCLGISASRGEEQLIQDWEVPWENAHEFIEYLLREVDLEGRPWVALPIEPQRNVTLYPMTPKKLYMNIGCYCYTRKPKEETQYYYTKILDGECIRLNGIKMLYSSSFMDKRTFETVYEGEKYRKLKNEYDPERKFSSLYEKAVSVK